MIDTDIRPWFVVSDLHLGDKGPRDNFAFMSDGRREHEFYSFLDYVDSHNGGLIIAGDLLELWQGNISKVITSRMYLLDRLAGMGAIYILGNHDIDLKYFWGSRGVKLTHPLFDHVGVEQVELNVAGKKILVIHGHEQDRYCRGDSPGIGRASAIYSGLREDRNGGPLWGKYGQQTVEARSLSRFDRWSRIVRRLLGRPNATTEMYRSIIAEWELSGCDALVFGHTHQPGKFEGVPIYNAGTWAEATCSFVKVDIDGVIGVFDWVDDNPVPNRNVLTVK